MLSRGHNKSRLIIDLFLFFQETQTLWYHFTPIMSSVENGIPREAKAPSLAQKAYRSGGSLRTRAGPWAGTLHKHPAAQRRYDLSKVTLLATSREILESRCQALSLIYFKKPRLFGAISPTHLQDQECRDKGHIVLPDTLLKAKVTRGLTLARRKTSADDKQSSGADLGAEEDCTATLGGLGQALSHVKASALPHP